MKYKLINVKSKTKKNCELKILLIKQKLKINALKINVSGNL